MKLKRNIGIYKYYSNLKYEHFSVLEMFELKVKQKLIMKKDSNSKNNEISN